MYAAKHAAPKEIWAEFNAGYDSAWPGHLSIRRRVIQKRRWTINIVLFIVTFVTTTVTGALYANSTIDSWVLFFLRGLVFSGPLMSILLVHEMGHYLAARRRFLDVTPPYFLPGIFPAGTFGAFIKIRSPLPDKRALMEVGAAGPIAGSLLAIPLLGLGLYLSEFSPEKHSVQGFDFGSSLILELMCLIQFGQFSFNSTVLLHPTALAAWFGLFVTAMNLLPIGQLDGGHVMYALFGPRRAHLISLGVFACLIPLGVFVWPGWLVFGLLTFFLGLRHPPPLDPYTPLDRRGRTLGWTAIILFVLTFIPLPVRFVE